MVEIEKESKQKEADRQKTERDRKTGITRQIDDRAGKKDRHREADRR